MMGNKALQRVLQANTAAASERSGSHADLGPIPVRGDAPVGIQPKLTVNTPGDVHEREADRVAEQVMRMPEPRDSSAADAPVRAAGENSHAPLQTKSVQAGDAGGGTAPPIVHDVLRSPGQPLDAATRAFMEPRFGQGFSDVRVHTDAKAAESAAAINARAYTANRSIVFGSAEYAPTTDLGRRLLSHELAHVLQQSAGTHSVGGHSREIGAGGNASHALQRQPTPKQQNSKTDITSLHFNQAAFQKMLEKWAVLDKLKHPFVDELAKAYVSRSGKIEWPDRVIKDTPYGGDKVIPGYHEPGYQEVYNAIYSVFSIKKVDKGGNVTDWQLGQVSTRQKSVGEQTKEAATFVAQEYRDDALEELAKGALKNVTAKVSTRWLAGRALVGVLELVPVVGEVVLTAMLVLDLLELYKSLGEPAELSPGAQKRANIIAGVQEWLLGKQEAAEREKRFGAPLVVPIDPVVPDRTAVRNY